ncbi:MAG: ester cyclase [Pseudomonadota bacterium]
MTDYQTHKALVLDYYRALDNASGDAITEAIAPYFSESVDFKAVHPFNEITNIERVAGEIWQPLHSAFSHLQRRMDVFFAGTSIDGESDWVVSMGHFMGLHDRAWLGIRPTGRIAMIRYADFNQVKDGKIVQTGFFVDIIGVMKQAGINPLPTQTGAELITPGPRTHDGLLFDAHPPEEGAATLDLLHRMIDDLVATYGKRMLADELRRTWCEDMAWYGPSGIGATYSVERYQKQHQYPFREGFKDFSLNGHVARFAEGHYAGFFGWPNLTLTPVGGFLGLPANDQPTHMRVVDIYRREGDKLAENWVLIDIPWWLQQQGIDVLARTEAHAS